MRTRDGTRLRSILNYAQCIGAEVREGGRHPFVLNYIGMMHCPVAESTNALTVVVPWFRQVTGANTSATYPALRTS